MHPDCKGLEPGSGELTVLLVDDEQNVLSALRRLLHRETFRIVTAESGEDGLWYLARLSNVALILSDQRMPNMNGAEFLRQSRQFAPDAIRILLTGHSDLADAVDAINRGGISRYLNKPWDDAELLQVIRSSVETYTLYQQNRRLQRKVEEQNLELQAWNSNLKERVLQQTTVVRQKNEELQKAIRRQQDDYHNFIASLVSLVEMRGDRTRRHAENVAKLSELVAKGLTLPDGEVQLIRTAAMLHDIGEIGIQERLLMISPESMSADDFAEYSKHPVRGQLLVDPVEELRPAGWLIRSHHEKFGGGGFPDGLAGEEIPLGARIIGYADMVDCAARRFSEDQAEQALKWTDLQVGKSLDPALQTLFHRFARYVYFSKPGLPDGASYFDEYQVRFDALEKGMVLSRTLYSGSGLMLLHGGVTLDSRKIESLRRYHELDQLEEFVWIRK